MFSFLLITQALAVEECESDPGYPFPQICCDPLPIDVCAKQAVPNDQTSAVYWISGAGAYHDSGPWDIGPSLSDDDPFNGLFLPNSYGTNGTPTSTSEVTCALTKADADIWCWGNVNNYSQVTGRPTGGSPYSSLDSSNWSAVSGGNGGIWVALDSTGTPKKWGKTNTTFDTGLPTSSGFERISVGTGPVGCAVDSAASGVSCWGLDTHLIVTNRPTTGNYEWVSLSEFNALAIDTSGAPVLWGNTALPQYANFRSEVVSAAATVGTAIKEAYLHDSGKYGVLWHTDRTLTIVEEGLGQNDILGDAPCGSGACVTGLVDFYHSDIQWRTSPRLNEKSADPIICGVVALDPGGTYSCGDVVCWGTPYSGGSGVPELVHSCTTDERAFCD